MNAPSPVTPQADDLSSAPLDPPTTLAGTLRRLGPGVIIAGAIVGSGELFATTGTGAAVGVGLLWLIVLGCVVKVFAQVELGRAAVVTRRTTLDLLNAVPGPRLPVGGGRSLNWIVLLWAAMMATQLGQMGGLAGGAGQALALAVPLTGDYAARAEAAADARAAGFDAPASPGTKDDKLWAALAAALTCGLLWAGRYGLIQSVSAVLVALFTLLTVGNAAALQASNRFALPAGDLAASLWPLNDLVTDDGAVFIALAAFGLIGVGATELVAYPYWCLEKGYARFAGAPPREDDPSRPAWLRRAGGWMGVMRADAFAALAVYTVSTVAFYLTGAAVLHPAGLNPGNADLIPVLGDAYRPAFGPAGWGLFLAGAVAVLYSTLLIATASNARMLADGARLAGWVRERPEANAPRAVRWLSVALPIVSVGTFVLVSDDPVLLVVIGGVAQSLLLPVLGRGGPVAAVPRDPPRRSAPAGRGPPRCCSPSSP